MTNILLITADDLDGRTPGAFGGVPGATPRLDALAAEGMSFHRAHVAAAVCQPSRSAIMTGRWPHRNGAEGFEPIRDGVTVLTELLRDAGYLCGILGKVEHLQPVDRFGWDVARSMRELGLGRNPAAYGAATRDFLARATAEGRPWFLMANAHDPHRPFSGSRQEKEKWPEEDRQTYPAPSRTFHADEVDVPGFLPDLPGVRIEYAEYLSSARRCDDVVGAVLGALDASEVEDTLVVFLSDNGMAFPFAKANCYLRSSLTPCIVRWPGVTEPGSADTRSFVSMLDLFPTFCAAAGIPIPGDLDGHTLVPLLRGEAQPDRERVFTVFHETSAKQRYEMRCTQDARFGYIWNAWSDGAQAYRAENMEGLSWPAMLADPVSADRTDFYLRRVPEELYDLESDPDCLRDLAGDPAYGDALAEARRHLANWLKATGDPLEAAYQSVVEA
ncbi:sulfatase family protein [Amycolatopsis taiwanensis]|uniref:Sulfatase atsG n=1 Tax=Amycolatopsis taiwanensis TaxID=342230 RepID=A0A9W6RB97_9PSEU|nr:sulfatase [Amycolatopsis taiwanensis]GLY71580.1 sulfatase atsG [Amycolatopsis taiwanensis]